MKVMYTFVTSHGPWKQEVSGEAAAGEVMRSWPMGGVLTRGRPGPDVRGDPVRTSLLVLSAHVRRSRAPRRRPRCLPSRRSSRTRASRSRRRRRRRYVHALIYPVYRILSHPSSTSTPSSLLPGRTMEPFTTSAGPLRLASANLMLRYTTTLLD